MGLAFEHIVQDNAMDQKGRRHAEGNQVGQGIKLAAERAFDAAHASDSSVKEIENARQQDISEGLFDGGILFLAAAGDRSASTIFVRATNPQNRLPAVSRFGRK